jgi:uncharacterized membrane protein
MSAEPPNPVPETPKSETAPRVLFDAVLVPHRSLGPGGFWLLMALISGLSFVSGVFFVLRGAWPVSGYFGLDVLLVYLAFKASYRSARLYETVKLTDQALIVERVGPKGQRHTWRFQPYWLRIEMDDPPEHNSQLRLTSHGRSLAIGSFLAPEERHELAEALRGALRQVRAAPRPDGWTERDPAPEAG